MKIKMSDVLRVGPGLEYILNGREKACRHNNEDFVVREPFNLDADTLLKLAINSGKLRDLQEAYGRTYNGLIKSLSNGEGSIVSGTKDAVILAEKNLELLDTEHEVDLQMIDIAKLKIGDNPGIAASLVQIMPIVNLTA